VQFEYDFKLILVRRLTVVTLPEILLVFVGSTYDLKSKDSMFWHMSPPLQWSISPTFFKQLFRAKVICIAFFVLEVYVKLFWRKKNSANSIKKCW
jgi:hypothetical protein